ncbi:hypothetical protein ACI784_22125 [Geodermatophilus sp. SYSU D01186]
MRGPVLLLLVACLSVVVVDAVIDGPFWLAVVALSLVLCIGALAVSTLHFRA